MYELDENGQPVMLQGMEEQQDFEEDDLSGADVELTEEQLVELLKNAD